MGKKMWLPICACILLAVFFGGVAVVLIKNESPDIKPFEVSEYQYYIDNFPSEENLGFISDANDLLKKVEAIWVEKYGERIKNEKPYQVFFDEKTGTWLVQGTLQSNMMGGVANILVKNDTGSVLAVWHDK